MQVQQAIMFGFVRKWGGTKHPHNKDLMGLVCTAHVHVAKAKYYKIVRGIGSNAHNNLVCVLPPNYSVTTIISKNDITKVTKSNLNLNSNKKVTFTYN